MPIPAQTIDVELTYEETNYIWDFIQTEYPNLTSQQVMTRLQEVAKGAIKDYIRYEIRRKQREAQRIESAQLDDVFNGEAATPATPVS